MVSTLPVYMRAHCKTRIVASKITGIAHTPSRFQAAFGRDGRIRFRADFPCGSMTINGIVLPDWSAATKVCTVCEDAAKGPSVYRCLNSAGYPVYIGSAVAALKRLKEHEWRSPWWPEVAEAKSEHFPNVFEARAAERLAIKAERPLYNKVHNGYHRRLA